MAVLFGLVFFTVGALVAGLVFFFFLQGAKGTWKPSRGMAQANRPLRQELLEVLQMDYTKLPIAVDLPRLITRTRLITVGEDASRIEKEYVPDLISTSRVPDGDENVTRNNNIGDLLLNIAKQVETDQKIISALEHEIDTKIRGNQNLDKKLATIFAELNLGNTNTMKILKSIVQRAVFAPSFRVKRKVMGIGHMTKDLLGDPKAWRIFIDFSKIQERNPRISVKHIRRERSASNRKEEYFEVEWALQILTDKNLKLLHTSLTILELACCKSMNSILKHLLEETLGVSATTLTSDIISD